MKKRPLRLLIVIGFILIISACQNQQLNLEYFIRDLNDDTIYEIVDETSIQQFQNQIQNGSSLQDTAVQEMEFEFHLKEEVIPFYIEEPYIIFSREEDLFISELIYSLDPIFEQAIVYEP